MPDGVRPYIQMPSSAAQIPPPAGSARAAHSRPSTFPPAAAAAAAAANAFQRKSYIPSTATLSSNVSDLVLSSLLPANLPRLPANNAAPGRARELTSQSEGLGLNVMSNNFRRFVTKVGPIFWLQDRVEEVLFWQKPLWTWAYMFTWTFICFEPRTLLFLPTAFLLLILLNLQEQRHTLPSLFGVILPPPDTVTTPVVPEGPTATGATLSSAPTPTTASASGAASISSSNPTSASGTGHHSPVAAAWSTWGDPAPAVQPKEAESSADVLMNMQAIQNLMGIIADAFETVTPWLTYLGGVDKASATVFPMSPTLLVLLLLPPTVLLPLTPGWVIPWLLLPAGIVPPLLLHPNVAPIVEALPRSRAALSLRAVAEDMVLTDRLPDSIGQFPISRVEVWENERLDPIVGSRPIPVATSGGPAPAPPPLPPGAWSSRHLRSGERNAWVKVRATGVEDGTDTIWADEDDDPAAAGEHSRMALALCDGWAFIPGEDWRVDVCGLWTEKGTDPDGWSYSNEHWNKASPNPIMPDGEGSVPTRKFTRRRRWWRRVYYDES